MSKSKERHGYRYTRTYSIWGNMKTRCNNTQEKDRKYYIDKNISYDPRWELFSNFLADMGECPEGLTLERRDNSLGYSKDNCCWASPYQQAANRAFGKITGVRFEQKRHFTGAWVARIQRNGLRIELYRGQDFFEACCARKSWESKNESRF